MENHTVEAAAPLIPLQGCPVETTLRVIGGKWKALILYYLYGKTRRFNELRRLLPQVTQQMLTTQLRELERDGVIVRHIYPQVPPKVEYSLTDLGRSLEPILLQMVDWGERYQQTVRQAVEADSADEEAVAR